MKILVIGGIAYIGSHMVKMLAEKNMECKLATDQPTPK
jgi:UDP-glucose 4-epimerase